MDYRWAQPGEMGGPVIDGLELRGMALGTFTDVDEGKRQVQVHFPHETVDSYRTVFGNQAFRDSFADRLPIMCWQHDLREPIGHAISAQVLPVHNEIVGQFDDFGVVPLAARAMEQIRSGTLRDFSFGFKGAKYERAENLGRGVRRIVTARMAEFSPVSIGSIPGAQAVGVREEGSDPTMTIEEIIRLRDGGLLTGKRAARLIREQYPEYREHIKVRDITGDDYDQDDPSGSAAMNMVSGPKWDATAAGLHTATGPNGEDMVVHSKGKSGAVWSVTDKDGDSVGTGKEDDIPTAKAAAEGCVKRKRDDTIYTGGDVTADDIRSALEAHEPEMAAVVRDVAIALGSPEDFAGQRSDEDEAVLTTLATTVESALDAAVRYVDDVDIATLPDEVQQAVALVRAAADASTSLVETLDVRADDATASASAEKLGWSTKPWDFSEADYTPAQLKSAALICLGDGSNKGDCLLPYKEPDGTINVHGVAAAAGRLNQTDAPQADKVAAARTLMSLYGKLRQPVPPKVLAIAGSGNRADDEGDDAEDEEEAKRKKAEALAKLDRMRGRVKGDDSDDDAAESDAA